MEKKMSFIDTLETYGNNDAIDAILFIMKSTTDSEVTKHGNRSYTAD
jgi:hypothetical protein